MTKKKVSTEEQLAERLENLAALGERALAGTERLVPSSLTRRERKALAADAKFASLRAYRRALDQVIAWALLGKISTRAAQELAQTVRVASELYMSEHILTATGKVDLEPEHIDGAEGGVPILPRHAPAYVETTVERTTGIGPKGDPIDITVVTAKGGPSLARNTPMVGPDLTSEPTIDLPLPPELLED